MSWRRAVVRSEVRRWGSAIEYAVALLPEDPPPGLSPAPEEHPPSGPTVAALAYRDLVGEPSIGDLVLLNTGALDRGLGTGGYAFIVAVPERLPHPSPGPGHIVKARYTPMQQMFLAIDEQDSPHHEALNAASSEAASLDGFPVVTADLHSALPALLAGIRADRPQARVGYVMTDGGALPMAFSRAVVALRDAGWLEATITVGQAFGGDHEAVTLHSALLAARHVLGLDFVVVTQGPGNVGTGTPWGFTGVAAGEALNAVHTLGGQGIGALRVSFADARERHRGISHHSRTAYGKVSLGRAALPYAAPTNDAQRLVAQQCAALAAEAQGQLTPHAVSTEGLLVALQDSPVRLATMGRGLDEDPEAFLASAVAGRYAVSLLS